MSDDLDDRVAAFRDPRDQRAARRQELVVELRGRGETQAAIAAALGISIATVHADLRAGSAAISAQGDAFLRGQLRGAHTDEQIDANTWLHGQARGLARRREIEARFGQTLRAKAGLPDEGDDTA